nr:hypothetical protein [Tanacetum cinerariifolium]
MNPRGGGAAGYGRVQNRVGNANPGQARQVKCYNCNGTGHIARNCTQPKRPQNFEYYKDKMLLRSRERSSFGRRAAIADDCDAFDYDLAPKLLPFFKSIEISNLNGFEVLDQGRELGFNSLVHSFLALSTLRRSGLRTASTAAKPCQGDSSKFYLITCSSYTDQRGTVVLATLFNESEQRHFRSFITNLYLQESRRL